MKSLIPTLAAGLLALTTVSASAQSLPSHHGFAGHDNTHAAMSHPEEEIHLNHVHGVEPRQHSDTQGNPVATMAVLTAIGAAIGGPTDLVVRNLIYGAVAGGGIGAVMKASASTNCKYTNTQTGETWKADCPADWETNRAWYDKQHHAYTHGYGPYAHGH